MSRLPRDPRLPIPPNDADPYTKELYRSLVETLRQMASQINLISENRIQGYHNSQSTAPTVIIQGIGDIVRNTQPTETGSSTQKYVNLGWIALRDGTASASSRVEMRVLTGN